MRSVLAAGALVAVAALTAGGSLTNAAPLAPPKDACTPGPPRVIGEGPLRWKPTARVAIRLPGPINQRFVARAGNAVVFGVYEGLSTRARVLAVDVATRKLLKLNHRIPAGSELIGLAASPTTAYAMWLEEESGLTRAAAFDIRTGARKDAWAPPGLGDVGRVYGMTVVGGNVIISTLLGIGSYDGVTGVPRWTQTTLTWGVVSDGKRLFVGVPPPSEGGTTDLLAALRLEDGTPIAGWGEGIPVRREGGTPFGIGGQYLFADGGGRPPFNRLIVRLSDGRPKVPPKLTRHSYPREGAKGILVGSARDRPNLFSDGVFDLSGKLIGTLCHDTRILAIRDARHLLAVHTTSDNAQRATLIEVARPS